MRSRRPVRPWSNRARSWVDAVIHLRAADADQHPARAGDLAVVGKVDLLSTPPAGLSWTAPAHGGSERSEQLLDELGRALLDCLGLPVLPAVDPVNSDGCGARVRRRLHARSEMHRHDRPAGPACRSRPFHCRLEAPRPWMSMSTPWSRSTPRCASSRIRRKSCVRPPTRPPRRSARSPRKVVTSLPPAPRPADLVIRPRHWTASVRPRRRRSTPACWSCRTRSGDGAGWS